MEGESYGFQALSDCLFTRVHPRYKKEATDGLSLHQFLQDQCIFLKVVSPKNGHMTNKFAIPGESTSFADHRA